jgi:hypothetical protein
LAAGALTADAVALEARRVADRDEAAPVAGTPGGEVPQFASLAERRLRTLPEDTRPLPGVAAYDSLLRHTLRPAPDPSEGESA